MVNRVLLIASIFLCVAGPTRHAEAAGALPLRLQVRPMDGEQRYFASNQPIWLTAIVHNSGPKPVSFMIASSDNDRMTISAVKPGGILVARWASRAVLEMSWKRIEVGPGADMRFQVLLQEHFHLAGEGAVTLVCRLPLRDIVGGHRVGDREPKVELTDEVHVEIRGALGHEESAALIATLGDEVKSSNRETAIRAVKSLGAIDNPLSISALAWTLQSNDEYVQLAAVTALSWVTHVSRIEVLRSFADSDQAAVRSTARYVLSARELQDDVRKGTGGGSSQSSEKSATQQTPVGTPTGEPISSSRPGLAAPSRKAQVPQLAKNRTWVYVLVYVALGLAIAAAFAMWLLLRRRAG